MFRTDFNSSVQLSFHQMCQDSQPQRFNHKVMIGCLRIAARCLMQPCSDSRATGRSIASIKTHVSFEPHQSLVSGLKNRKPSPDVLISRDKLSCTLSALGRTLFWQDRAHLVSFYKSWYVRIHEFTHSSLLAFMWRDESFSKWHFKPILCPSPLPHYRTMKDPDLARPPCPTGQC